MRSIITIVFAVLSFGSVHTPRFLGNLMENHGAGWTTFVLPYLAAMVLGFLWRAIIKLLILGIILGLAAAFIWMSVSGCHRPSGQICSILAHNISSN